MLGVMVPTFNLSTQEQRQVDFCELQAHQCYIVSPCRKKHHAKKILKQKRILPRGVTRSAQATVHYTTVVSWGYLCVCMLTCVCRHMSAMFPLHFSNISPSYYFLIFNF